MSKRSQDKRRARSKEKKAMARRMRGMSPLSRLAGDAESTCEIWQSYCEEDNRMSSMYVIRPLLGGGFVAACFLIDYDCIGLKDAFCRLDVAPGDIREHIQILSREGGMTFVKIEVARARELVAGAIRWTKAQSFRLPGDLERCLKILGGLPDVDGADIGKFGHEGGLLYVGRKVDLERRLVGTTMEEFLDREDVDYTFEVSREEFEGYGGIGEEDMEDEEEFEDEEEMTESGEDLMQIVEKTKFIQEAFVAEVRDWCRETGQTPEEQLEVATRAMLCSILAAMMQERATDADTMKAAERHVEEILLREPTNDGKGVLRACRQLIDCMKTRPNMLAQVEREQDLSPVEFDAMKLFSNGENAK